jgi:hypothetical protein
MIVQNIPAMELIRSLANVRDSKTSRRRKDQQLRNPDHRSGTRANRFVASLVELIDSLVYLQRFRPHHVTIGFRRGRRIRHESLNPWVDTLLVLPSYLHRGSEQVDRIHSPSLRKYQPAWKTRTADAHIVSSISLSGSDT